MALARVTVKVSDVDCLVVEPAEMPCHGLEAACWVAELAEAPCRCWEAVRLIAEFAEMQCLDWQAVEAEVVGGIERAWAFALRSQVGEAGDMAAFAGVFLQHWQAAGIVESAVGTQAEASVHHSPVVEGPADTVQVVELGHY